MTTQQNHVNHKNSGIIGVFIGLAVLFFGLLLALFVLKTILAIFFALAPVAGLALTAYGGYRYVNADAEGEKLQAMKIVAGGLAVFTLGIIF